MNRRARAEWNVAHEMERADSVPVREHARGGIDIPRRIGVLEMPRKKEPVAGVEIHGRVPVEMSSMRSHWPDFCDWTTASTTHCA